mgnify:CR=1 FL=1
MLLMGLLMLLVPMAVFWVVLALVAASQGLYKEIAGGVVLLLWVFSAWWLITRGV